MLNEAPRAENLLGRGGMGASSLISTLGGIELSSSCPSCHTPQKKGLRCLLGRKMSPLRGGLCRRSVRVAILAYSDTSANEDNSFRNHIR